MSPLLCPLISDQEESAVGDWLTFLLHVLVLCKVITVHGAEESGGVWQVNLFVVLQVWLWSHQFSSDSTGFVCVVVVVVILIVLYHLKRLHNKDGSELVFSDMHKGILLQICMRCYEMEKGFSKCLTSSWEELCPAPMNYPCNTNIPALLSVPIMKKDNGQDEFQWKTFKKDLSSVFAE